MSLDTDVTLEDIARLCDVFISEGRKWEHSSERLLSSVIQNCRRLPLSDQTKGGMLAKGRLLGIQFLELLQDGLYFDLGEHAVKLAQKLREGYSTQVTKCRTVRQTSSL